MFRIDERESVKKLEAEKNRLIKLIESLNKDKWEEELNNIQSQGSLMEKELVILEEELQRLKESSQKTEELDAEERLGLIELDQDDKQKLDEYFSCPLNFEVLKDPVMLNNDSRHVIDKSSMSLLTKKDGYYIHPFIPGYEVYENDQAKTGKILKKIDGKIDSFTPIPERMKELESFIEQAEKKYYINENSRISKRKDAIHMELKDIEIRKIEILTKIEQLDQTIRMAEKEIAELTVTINGLSEKIDVQDKIVSLEKQAKELEETISTLAQVMKDEDKMEQHKIDEILVPQVLELEDLKEIIRGLKGEGVQDNKEKKNKGVVSSNLSLSTLSTSQLSASQIGIRNNLLGTSLVSFPRSSFGMWSPVKPPVQTTIVSNPVNNGSLPGLRNNPNTDEVD